MAPNCYTIRFCRHPYFSNFLLQCYEVICVLLDRFSFEMKWKCCYVKIIFFSQADPKNVISHIVFEKMYLPTLLSLTENVKNVSEK